MPTVSQSLKASGAIQAYNQIYNEICTSAGLLQGDGSGKSTMPAGDHWNACGYCSLLANSPPPTASFALLLATSVASEHASPLLYDYIAPRPFRGRTHPLDPPPAFS
ncbi:DUF2946 domain-containing protein [Collimonas pratensis]|nr:DUF2946 domain-containing protein [Collimonas pratensis]